MYSDYVTEKVDFESGDESDKEVVVGFLLTISYYDQFDLNKANTLMNRAQTVLLQHGHN